MTANSETTHLEVTSEWMAIQPELGCRESAVIVRAMDAFMAVRSAQQSAYTLWEQIVGFILAPPATGLCFRLMTGRWARPPQADQVNSRIEERQLFGFWLLVGALYTGEMIIFACANIFGIRN